MRLSVITISFNAEECISRTINSILAQTLPVYEYIMIDGASKDKTNEIICSYDDEFARRGIRFIHVSEPDAGISDAFNKGIAMATGDLVGIINADDELMVNANEILSQYYSETQADVYYGNCIWVDSEHKIEYISKPHSHNLSMLVYNMILIHPSTFVRKDTYEKYGTFNTTYKYCMDKEFLYRLYKHGAKFLYIDKELTKFKAGGVSDKHTNAVFIEGRHMALEYGKPWIVVMAVEIKKRTKTYKTKKLKGTRLYRIIKKHM